MPGLAATPSPATSGSLGSSGVGCPRMHPIASCPPWAVAPRGRASRAMALPPSGSSARTAGTPMRRVASASGSRSSCTTVPAHSFEAFGSASSWCCTFRACFPTCLCPLPSYTPLPRGHWTASSLLRGGSPSSSPTASRTRSPWPSLRACATLSSCLACQRPLPFPSTSSSWTCASSGATGDPFSGTPHSGHSSAACPSSGPQPTSRSSPPCPTSSLAGPWHPCRRARMARCPSRPRMRLWPSLTRTICRASRRPRRRSLILVPLRRKLAVCSAQRGHPRTQLDRAAARVMPARASSPRSLRARARAR
mmetsp:Transcript_11596/g.34366  ORF Transcript_11596/g.34366 Transcript_11596/m.34366 type:complete len:308 (+) Transcript_11596:898-1821(+)